MKTDDKKLSFDTDTIPHAVEFFNRVYYNLQKMYSKTSNNFELYEYFQTAKWIIIQIFILYITNEVKSPSPDQKYIDLLESMIVHIAMFDFESYPPSIPSSLNFS